MFYLMAAPAQFEPHHTYRIVPECNRTSELQHATSMLLCHQRITLRCATFCSSSATAWSSPASKRALGSIVLGNSNGCSACVVCMAGKSWNLNPAWLLPLLSILVPAGLPLPSCSTNIIIMIIINMLMIIMITIIAVVVVIIIIIIITKAMMIIET